MKRAVEDYFLHNNLSENQIKRLREIEKIYETSHASASFFKMKRFHYAAMTLLFLAVFSSLFWIKPWNKKNILESLAFEIASHHKKEMPLEIKNDKYDKIRKYFAKLDFNLVESKYLEGERWKLLGGRYCSFRGHIAAQLRIKNIEDNKIYTLYEVKIPNLILSNNEKLFDEKEIRVKLWREDDIILGLAGKRE